MDRYTREYQKMKTVMKLSWFKGRHCRATPNLSIGLRVISIPAFSWVAGSIGIKRINVSLVNWTIEVQEAVVSIVLADWVKLVGIHYESAKAVWVARPLKSGNNRCKRRKPIWSSINIAYEKKITLMTREDRQES